jgi:type IV pilus assembly protein PilC
MSPVYSYLALDASGKEQTGKLEASTEREAVRLLRERSIYAVKIREGEAFSSDGSMAGRLAGYRDYLNPLQYLPARSGDLIVFFRQLALMLRAGYTLVIALDATYEMVPRLQLRRAIKRMSEEIRRGTSFSATLAAEKRVFLPMIAKLVESGEKSGNLDAILDRLADSMERSKALKRQLVSALTYPCFVILASVAVTIFLVIGVIPRFATFLEARALALPASTQMLLDISAWALDYGKFVAGVTALLTFGLLVAYTSVPGKRVIDRIILRIPIIGSAVLYAGMAQTGWTMSMLLRSGVTALESLRITAGVLTNLAISDCFSAAAKGLLAGRALSKALQQKRIPLMMQHMAAVGESSGQLDTVMFSVGEYYQKELEAQVKTIAVLIEPTLILMVGGMVGFVYFAFFQAVMTVSTGGR